MNGSNLNERGDPASTGVIPDPLDDIPRVPCRSCGAEMLFAKTLLGRDMPVDAKPVTLGNVKLERDGTTLRALVVRDGEGTHVAHFATCPEAGKHRRKR